MSPALPPIARPLALLTILTSVAVVASGLVTASLAAAAPMLAQGQRPSWALFGFECVVVVAGVLGVLTGRNRFQDGPGLALACVSGTILFASALGWAGAGRNLMSVSLLPLLGGRVAAAGVLGAIGAWCVLSRANGALRLAVIGAALLLPVLLGAGFLASPAGRKALERVGAAGPGLQFIAAVGAFALVTILLSAGTHLLVTAFEQGRPSSRKA